MSFSHYDPYATDKRPPSTNPAASTPPTYSSHNFAADESHSDSDSSDDECETKNEVHGHCAAAQKALREYGFPATHQSRVAIILDVSQSMEGENEFYSSGKIQRLIQKAMAMAIELAAGKKHSVTIFPFGSKAHEPIVVTEHHIGEATNKVFLALNRKLDNKTDYGMAMSKVRQHYFSYNGPLSAAPEIAYDGAPVFALFVTDGDLNPVHVNGKQEAINQFRYSQYNPMFIKFIALKGKQANLEFHALKEICAKHNTKFLPNRDLTILSDPDDLKIEELFGGYPTWLEEAHEHKILANDPGFKINPSDPRHLKEIAKKEAIEEEHGHEDLDDLHGHGSKPSVSQNRYGLMNQSGKKADSNYHKMEEKQDNDNCCPCAIL